MQLDALVAALRLQRGSLYTSWAIALARTSVVLPNQNVLIALLRDLTEQLIEALAAPDPVAVRTIGERLVAARLSSPPVLAATLQTLRAAIWPLLPDPTPRALAQRIEAMLCEIATGFDIAVRAALLHEQEQIRAALISAYQSLERERDTALVTERARLEERVVEQTAELRALNAALQRADWRKDELLAALSHELRTPLSLILGLSDLLVTGGYGPLSEIQATQVSQIERSGQHLLGFVNDILDLAQISAGRLELVRERVAVPLLCELSLAAVAQSASDRRVTLDLDLDARVVWVEGDTRRLHDILVRLLTNAIQFTPEGGRAGLSVCGQPATGRTIWTVWDTGSGIMPGDIQRLFRPFEQLDSGMARRIGGLGLGLALVASLARLHGGDVQVESEPGSGSRFSVWLPWSSEAPGLSPADGGGPGRLAPPGPGPDHPGAG